MNTFIVTLAISAGLAACSTSPSTTPDTAAYGQVASDIKTAVDAHRAASASFATQSDCGAERERYSSRMTPLLDRMQGMSGGMDACMTSMGHHDSPTMADTCASMRSELGRHMAAACASPRASDQSAEANVHADRMIRWASAEADESARLGGMMGGGSGMMSGSGCHM